MLYITIFPVAASRVSILARPEGRALPTAAHGVRPHGAVSILARPEGRALRTTEGMNLCPFAFQSSPAPKDWRYAPPQRSAPPPRSFNPRPPRRTGATEMDQAQEKPSKVSILARPEGRALLSLCPFATRECLFQSSPAPKDGRYAVRCVRCRMPHWFQSSPAPKDGRYTSLASMCRADVRFNPRPPRRTGATASASD